MFLSTCASTVVHSETSWLRGVSKTPQYFLSTLSKPAGSSATAFCYALNPRIFDFFFFFGITIKMYFAAASLPCSYLTFRHLSSGNTKIINGNTDHFYSTKFMASYRRKFLNLIIIHKLKKARNYYLCQSIRNKWKEGLLACSVPQPQSWQAWLQINSTSIQEALKCIWNLIPSCKILKASHITC